MPDDIEGAPCNLLFDLDGTLVDSAPDLAGALNRLRAEQGLAALAIAQVKGMVGDGVAKLVERGLPPSGEAAPGPGDRERLVRRFLEIYEARLTAETRPYPGVVETLEILAAADKALAVP
ncbi:MAG: HAD hydrolase-like protein, partial [Rhodospirillales bacterium]|nr:HAD hydrolase-like protein [Rhodospirillales bacterium]